MKTSLTLACALLTGTAGWAQGLELSGSSSAAFEVAGQKKKLESPKSMFFEVKISPFTPALDRPFMDLPAEERPYYAVFGGGPMLLGEIEVEYQFFQKFGTLAGRRLDIPADDERHFAQVVKRAFAQRRKTLRNNLKGFIDADTIGDCGIDPSARAETLTVAEFVRLSNRTADQSWAQ